MQIGLIELFGMEEIKQYINLQMRKMLEIFEKIIKFDAETLVYVSCKASSLAKDLLLFEEGGYKVRKICSVDMFPRTYHVETVVLLSKVTD